MTYTIRATEYGGFAGTIEEIYDGDKALQLDAVMERLAKLQAENDRLRAALEQALSLAEECKCWGVHTNADRETLNIQLAECKVALEGGQPCVP